MLAYYVHNLSPDLIRFTDKIGVHWYGLCYVLGFYAAFLVMRYLARRGLSEVPEKDLADLITGTAIFGVVLGGRLGFMLLYNLDEFLRAPWTVFRIWDGGMASHGGIVGVALYLLWYARTHKLSWTGIGDTLVCGAPLGILLVRIANFINGELFGRITNVSWAVKFPTEIHHPDFVPAVPTDLPLAQFPQHSPDILAVYQQGFGDVTKFTDILNPRHPSQLYEAAGEGLFLFLALFATRLLFKKLPNGVLTGLFFLLYAVVRIVLENYREPDSQASMINGLSRGQFYSVFFVLVGLAFLAFGWWQGRKANPHTAG
jgi:phosphatidylglycerol:prolipoprotein diacylglycerol transferase